MAIAFTQGLPKSDLHYKRQEVVGTRQSIAFTDDDTSWSGDGTDIHSIVIFARIFYHDQTSNSKLGTLVPEPAASLDMSEVLESGMVSSRNATSSKSRYARRHLAAAVYKQNPGNPEQTPHKNDDRKSRK